MTTIEEVRWMQYAFQWCLDEVREYLILHDLIPNYSELCPRHALRPFLDGFVQFERERRLQFKRDIAPWIGIYGPITFPGGGASE